MQLSISFRVQYALAFLVLGLFAPHATAARFSAVLEGQSKNDTNWISNNLQGWQDCDSIPMRVYVTGGPASSQSIQVYFDHFSGTVPGVQDLMGFSPSSNVSIITVPTLAAPANSGTWFYTFTINLLDRSPGFVEFRGLLASGAHLNPGSSLHLGGTPSLSTLQIFKPAPGSALPDLAVVKDGPSQTRPGAIITYMVNYTNKALCASDATNAQLSDMLPASVSYVANSASGNATQLGSSLVWDLGTLGTGARGSVSYQVKVNTNLAYGFSFTNGAHILSAVGDANPADNVSRVITTVLFNRAPIANNDSYSVNEDGMLTVGAPGVLSNDIDPDGDRLTAQVMSLPAHGSLSFSTNGAFVYTPLPAYNGTDSFTYRASDGQSQSGVVTVSLAVQAVNDPPSFTKGPSQLVNEDAGPQTVTNWATHITAGPPDEASQVLAFLVTNDTNALCQVALSPSTAA